MKIWKGGPVEDFSEMGVEGSILCKGPLESIVRFVEPTTGRKYFDPEVYENGWKVCYSAVINAERKIYKTSITLTFYRKLIPMSALKLMDDYRDCDFEIKFDFEGQLSDWWKIRNFKTIPDIAELLKQGVIDGHETMSGVLRFGKSFNKHLHEELILDLDTTEGDRRIIKQDINLINNTLNINKFLFISK